MSARRVLIVEDEQILAAQLECELRRSGYEIAGLASSGEEALCITRKTCPSVVLMDVRLRGPMDGLEAARLIRKITLAPIIYLTGYADVFLRDPSLMQEPCLCIAKPFVLPDLLSILEVAMAPDAHRPGASRLLM